jgi:peptidyl-Lys metalloendopeptidase
MLQFTLTNNSDKTLTILKWNTPLDGFYSDMFLVARDGEAVSYLGVMVLREEPRPEDYIVLKPGESASTEFDLGEQYALVDAGEYTVQYQVDSLTVGMATPDILATTAGQRTLNPLDVESGKVTFTLVENREAPVSPLVVPGFHGCSEDRQNTIYAVLPEAESMSLNAHAALTNLARSERSHAERYITWFGTYTAERYQEVVENLEAIQGALGHSAQSFDCAPSNPTCEPGWVAYVYPNRPYEVNLCNPFWGYPITGGASQAGILTHEISHFNVVAGTDDHAYCWTQANCSTLDPEAAIANADSYRRFIENDPPLQPVGPVQYSIFCPQGERCCAFQADNTCSLCVSSSTSCDSALPECSDGDFAIETCTVRVGGREQRGSREVTCVDGKWRRGPCYPNPP